MVLSRRCSRFQSLLQYCVLRCCFSCFNLHVVVVCFMLLQQQFGVVVVLCSWCFRCSI
ncbi:hypothetical protein BDA96_09G167500 [Sorghum bicolor]|uniref:Uncharacterized protein n=1 Tax=Sorghum bicolor TaxID=4558 RepID=A0A921QAX8_SORBI|nr:hypothetical protein BDA96_09G167500 [Sorghum bicolor]